MIRSPQRAGAAVCVAVAGMIASTAPAAAHTITGVASTNYESVLLGPTPQIPGISMHLRDLGRRVEVANTTRTDLVISGYDNEPFLRVGPSGVYENLRSPTVYQNRTTITGLPYPIPPDATPNAGAEWSRLSGAHIARWRDRRTRHEGATPAAVEAAPHQGHVLATWSILMQFGTTQVVANGLIRWVPPPSPLPWLALAMTIAASVFVATTSRRWGPVLAVATAAVVAVDIVHAVVAVIPASDSLPQTVSKLLLTGFLSVSAWIASAIAVPKLQQGSKDAVFLAGYGAFAAFLIGGIGDAAVLGRSQIPYAVAPVVARILVSVTIGLTVGVVVSGIKVVRGDAQGA